MYVPAFQAYRWPRFDQIHLDSQQDPRINKNKKKQSLWDKLWCTCLYIVHETIGTEKKFDVELRLRGIKTKSYRQAHWTVITFAAFFTLQIKFYTFISIIMLQKLRKKVAISLPMMTVYFGRFSFFISVLYEHLKKYQLVCKSQFIPFLFFHFNLPDLLFDRLSLLRLVVHVDLVDLL